jgi:hypothetical protein
MSEGRLKRLANSHRLFLWLLGVLFLLLEFLAHIPGPDSHLGEFLRHLGLVSGIAAVSSFVVDRYLKEQFAKDIAKDVASQVFVYGLSKEVADEVDWARKLGVVRVNTKLSFAFSQVRVAGGGFRSDLVKLETTFRFSIENRTDSDFPFEHGCRVRTQIIPATECPFTVFECIKATDVDGSGYGLNQGDVRALRLASGDWEINKAVIVKPNKGSVRHTFVHKAVQIYRMEDQELFTFRQPTIGCEITIDSNPLALDITPIILHRLGRTHVRKTPEQNPTQYKFDQAFLGVGVLVLNWRKSRTL